MKNRIILLLIFIIISCDSSPDMNIKNIENKTVQEIEDYKDILKKKNHGVLFSLKEIFYQKNK